MTIIELMFLEGVVTSLRNPSQAITSLNEHINFLEQSKNEVSDMHPCLWRFASMVLRGEKVV